MRERDLPGALTDTGYGVRMARSRTRIWYALAACGIATSCVGTIDDPPGGAPPSSALPPDIADEIERTGCTDFDIGEGPMRRLTATEYANSVQAIFGVDADVSFFAADEHVGPFRFNTEGAVTNAHVGQYMDAAEAIAASAVSAPGVLPDCATGSADAACARELVERLGLRVFRRPLSAGEVDELAALHATGSGFADGARLVVQAMLQSPHFLYVLEHGDAAAASGGLVPLTSYEIAARLALFLWASAPDDELLAAAAADELREPEQVGAQARRMIDDPRAMQQAMRFYFEWLGLDGTDSVTGIDDLVKDAEAYPEFTDTLRASMKNETVTFLRDLHERHGALGEMFTATASFADAELARHYGIAAPASGGFGPVELDPGERSGLLTQATVMSVYGSASQSSPVHRGVFVLERVLCRALPPPPPSVNAQPPEPDPNVPRRAQFEQHRADPACASCHSLIDPVGFGFEAYDGIGRFRTVDGGEPVDDTGEITLDGTPHAFDGAVELSGLLAGSDDARSCFALQWFRYGVARLESPADACGLEAIARGFAESGYDVREVAVLVAKSALFRYRRTPEGE